MSSTLRFIGGSVGIWLTQLHDMIVLTELGPAPANCVVIRRPTEEAIIKENNERQPEMPFMSLCGLNL